MSGLVIDLQSLQVETKADIPTYTTSEMKQVRVHTPNTHSFATPDFELPKLGCSLEGYGFITDAHFPILHK